MVNGISTQAHASDSPPAVATESAKRPSSKKKAGRSKKLVARRGPHRASGEEAIELAVSSSDEDGHASSGSESDGPDTEEEADLQFKKLALEKLSLERKDDPSPVACNKAPPRKQQNRGRAASQESQPSPQPSSHNRDSAPASPTPSLSSHAPNATPTSSKKKRNKKAKQDQKQGQAPVAGDNKENAQSQKKGTDGTQQHQSTTPSSSSSAPPAQSQQPTDPEPNASSKASRRLSKQGVASSKSNVASPSPAQDVTEDDSPTADWGDSPMPEPSPAAEKSSENGQNQQQQQQNKSTAQMGRAVSRGRGGKAAVEARVEYRRRLAEDPRFVPHLGEFWGHDDRYRGAGLKNFSDRGGFRGRFMGRGGFGRGGMAQGPTRGDFKNESPTAGRESPSQEPEDKDGSSAKPKSDRWSHDGYDQMMKVQEKSYRHQRNDSRPRSMNAKV
ncbi:hypothetical protein EDD21DRAFT_80196 [Dissophora ornata]|nr:hypothetical protein EDD21DRAFT_80196 [Dissophora ornata]